MWYGVVWCGMVWYGVVVFVVFDAVCRGMVWYFVMWHPKEVSYVAFGWFGNVWRGSDVWRCLT